MEKLILQERDITGKKVKNLREQGLVPAVVYNSKTESFNTVISNKDAQWLYKNTTSTTILNAQLNEKNFKCLVKDFDINSVTGEINHVSLFEIDENVVMSFTIPFEIIGVSPAVKNNLGVLVNPLTSIDVHCRLADLVPSIQVDISDLQHPGQSIIVRDVKLPNGINIINEEILDAAIVTITELQKLEEVETPVEEEVETEGVEGNVVEEETTDTVAE